MTYKERLEEIKEIDITPLCFYLDNMTNFDGKLLKEQWKWLINCVEELEMQLSINTNNMKQLQKENGRYKQALEEIRGLYPLRNVGYQVSEIRKIVIKALEGEG